MRLQHHEMSIDEALSPQSLLTPLIIDIPKERAPGSALIPCPRDDHPHTDPISCHSMDLIVNELTGGVEL